MEQIDQVVERLPDLLFKSLIVVFIFGFIIREVKTWFNKDQY